MNPGIESVEMFKYDGKVFETMDKAIDHAESLVGDTLKPDLLARGFTISEWVKVVETILKHRAALVDLLDY